MTATAILKSGGHAQEISFLTQAWKGINTVLAGVFQLMNSKSPRQMGEDLKPLLRQPLAVPIPICHWEAKSTGSPLPMRGLSGQHPEQLWHPVSYPTSARNQAPVRLVKCIISGPCHPASNIQQPQTINRLEVTFWNLFKVVGRWEDE